jgi:non-ribosomal peptide synthetase component F
VAIEFEAQRLSYRELNARANRLAYHLCTLGVGPDQRVAIYTSGSTGQPRGVMVEHRGVVNRLLWMQEAYGLTAEDGVMQRRRSASTWR